MGSFVFQWRKPASEVFVTGTFDNWSKSVPLTKEFGVFRKRVDLPQADSKILYKFLVDGNWTTDHTAPVEIDEHGNANNVLKPEDITKNPAANTISSVGPGASTLSMAAQQPLEKDRAQDQTYSVAPLPATSGPGNPITLAPGEPVPNSRDITANTVESTIKTDKASYEKGETLNHVIIQGGGPFSSAAAKEAEPPKEHVIIQGGGPYSSAAAKEAESSPLQHVIIQGGGPYSSTAAMAGQVPLEPRGVAQVVEDEQSSPVGHKVPQDVGDGSEIPVGHKVPQQVGDGSPPEVGHKVPQTVGSDQEDSTTSDKGLVAGAAGVAVGAAAVGGAVTYGATSSSGVPEVAKESTSAAGGSGVTYGATSSSGVPEVADKGLVNGTSTTTTSRDLPPSVQSKIADMNASSTAQPTSTSAPSQASTTVLAASGALAGGAVIATGAAVMAHPDPKIADEDTMPAIAVANQNAVPPSEAANARANTGVAAFRDDPVSAPGSTAAPVTTKYWERDPRTVAAAFANDPIAATPEAFHGDPVSAPGYSATPSSKVTDPRTIATAFVSDPISAAPPGTSTKAATASAPPATPTKATTASAPPVTPTKATTASAPVATPTKTTPSNNKPFAAANRDISPTTSNPPPPVAIDHAPSATSQASGPSDAAKRAQALLGDGTASSPASPATNSTASTDKKSKRKSFLVKFKDAFKPKPA